MRFTRKLLAIIIVLGMVLALAPKAASAAGPAWPTEADARKDQTDYLKGLGSDSSSESSKLPNGVVIDGFQIPPDVAAMKSFKDGTVHVLVTVPGDTLSAYAKKQSSSLSKMTRYLASPAVVKIKADQDASVNAAKAKGVTLKNIQRFSVLFNGYSAQISVKDLGKLADAVGRSNIHFSRLTQLEDTSSNALIGADAVRADPGVDGTGAYVGVIDTGVDYTHPDFGGDGTNHGFPTAKIVAGYDFAGDNPDALNDRSLMSPDPDPMDSNEHGTHVSGIIAADGVVTGVAPKAKIVIAKIVPAGLGSAWTEEIVAAWEYMADPNNVDDGPEGSHPPVLSVNMSFGSVAGFDDPTEPERIAIENAIASGIVATLSAGNSASNYAGVFSQTYNFTPDYSTVGSPAVTPDAISVASSENSWMPAFAVTETSAAADYGYLTGSTSPDPITAVGDNGGAGYQYVYCGIGQASDFLALDLTGKIALIDRGSISFYVKINNAAAAGAAGVVIANNAAGTISMNTAGSTLASVSITQADGLTLKAKAAAPVGDGTGLLKFLGHFVGPANPAVDTISTFSSWGATPNLTFKPEVTAPGGNIWSTVPVAQGSYANLSGTSMAAPHVAGAAALVKLVHPTWTVEQVKTALMNTATLLVDPVSPTDLPYSPRLQGAGRINVNDALHNDVTITSQLDGKAAVALGSVESWADDPITFPLVLHNSGASDVTYGIGGTIQWVNNSWVGAGSDAYAVSIPGAVFGTSPAETVTVPAGGTRTVTVTIDATGVTLDPNFFPYVEGFVSFTPGEGGVALHVPYMGFLGNWNDFDSETWAPTFNPLVDPPYRAVSYTAQRYASTVDLGKTGITWPEDPTNGWNQLGKTFSGAFDADTIAINPDRSSSGPNGGVENNIYVLRNIENLKVEIRDSSDNLVKLIDDVNGVWKGNYAQYGNQYSWYWSGNAAWQWYGDDADGVRVADGQYYLNTMATAEKVINKPGYDAPQTVSFPVFVDSVNPTVEITSVVPAGANQTVNWTVNDAAPSSGLWGYTVYYSTNGASWSHIHVAPTETSAVVPAGTMVEVDVFDNAHNIGWDTYAYGQVLMTTSLPSTVTLGALTPFTISTTNYGIALPGIRFDGTLAVPTTWAASDVVLEYYDNGTSSWLPVTVAGGAGTLTFSLGSWTGDTFPAETTLTTSLRMTVGAATPGRIDMTVKMDTVDGTGTTILGTFYTLAATTYAIAEPLTMVETTNPPDGSVGHAYSATPHATGGVAPYTWTITGLPAGLTYTSATGNFFGTPTVGGVFPITFTVHDSGILSFSRSLTLTIHHLDFTNLPASLSATSVFTPVSTTVVTADLPVTAFSVVGVTVDGVPYVPLQAPSITQLDDHSAQFTWPADFTERGKTVVFTIRAVGSGYTAESTITVNVNLPSLLVFVNGEGGQVLMIDTDANKIRAVCGSYDSGWQDVLAFHSISGIVVFAVSSPTGTAYISANLNLATGTGIVQVIDLAGSVNYSYVWHMPHIS
jgi:lactocepin